MDLDEVNEELNLNLPVDKSYESLGGFIFEQLGIVFYAIIGSLIATVVGAVILLFIIDLFKKK